MTREIRNFCIIAHIDHGKSTLADRFIEYCGGLSAREMSAQVLDSMDIERERGITIKAQCVSLRFQSRKSGKEILLNLIDTPGHVDFTYEVSRSLAACEGALLLVDASQGVQAQTVANCYTAVEQGLEIIPVLNKIDLPASEPERAVEQIEENIGIPAHGALMVSAKTGLGVEALLELLVEQIPPPTLDDENKLKALIIDSWFDRYVGVVSLVRVVQGQLVSGQKMRVMSTARNYEIEEVGIFTPKKNKLNVLRSGEVGYLIAGIKDVDAAPVGDTITEAVHPATEPLPGFMTVKPQVFAGLFPTDSSQFEGLREALGKLRLNDAALSYEPEVSTALGLGFRCGFLGMLHLEIVRERLEREYELELIIGAPTVIYELLTSSNEIMTISSPSQLPDTVRIQEWREPIATVDIITPEAYLGNLMQMLSEKRGVQQKMSVVNGQATLGYQLPMSELVSDFFEKIKSLSRGYASFDYKITGFQVAPLVKLDLLINGEKVDALSTIVHSSVATNRGKELVERMRKAIPRQLFDVAIQAAVGSKIIARETVKALRKNVTAKCYGGDVSRKRKLLEKQKAGKKRMKQLGKVEVPQAAFLSVFRGDQ